jgi:hypothetical protein
MRMINSTLLRLLLFALGQGLALISRISPSVRSQITRTLTFEISTDDGVARATTTALAITRCSSSTSPAIWNDAPFAPATSTVPKDGMKC